MKKIITLILILVLALSLVLALASCADEEEPNNENGGSTPQGPGIGDTTDGWNGQDTPLVPLPELDNYN